MIPRKSIASGVKTSGNNLLIKFRASRRIKWNNVGRSYSHEMNPRKLLALNTASAGNHFITLSNETTVFWVRRQSKYRISLEIADTQLKESRIAALQSLEAYKLLNPPSANTLIFSNHRAKQIVLPTTFLFLHQSRSWKWTLSNLW